MKKQVTGIKPREKVNLEMFKDGFFRCKFEKGYNILLGSTDTARQVKHPKHKY